MRAINASGYTNPAVDKLIEQAAGRDERGQAQGDSTSRCGQIVLGDAPLIFTHFETINYLMRKNVTGSTINPTLELRMEDVAKS